MTPARSLKLSAAALLAGALTACGGAEVDADDYAEVDTTPVYTVEENRAEGVMGAVETYDADDDYLDDDMDDEAVTVLPNEDVLGAVETADRDDADMDDDDDDDDVDELEPYRAVTDYSPERK